jgi:hypothetical protein
MIMTKEFNMKRIALVALMLVGFALAGQQTFDMRFRSGGVLYATESLPASAACTTQWQSCRNARAQSLTWQQWVTPGATDSVRLKIERQYTIKDTTRFITAIDTIITVAVSNVAETTGAPRVYSRQFWPLPCLIERFIVTGIAGNSEASHVGGMILQTDDLQP